MKIKLGLLILTQLLALRLFAAESTIQVTINEHTLSCNPKLSVLVPSISHIVDGNYPDFKFSATGSENLCFYRHYLIDKASQNNGELTAQVVVQKHKLNEPIYKCPPRKRPCPFCDPPLCDIVGYKEYIEESVSIEILGLRFYEKSKLTPN